MRGFRIPIALLLLYAILLGPFLCTQVDASSPAIRMEAKDTSNQKPLCHIGGDNRCRPDGSASYQGTHELLQPSTHLPSFLPLLFKPLPSAENSHHPLDISKEILKPPEIPIL